MGKPRGRVWIMGAYAFGSTISYPPSFGEEFFVVLFLVI